MNTTSKHMQIIFAVIIFFLPGFSLPVQAVPLPLTPHCQQQKNPIIEFKKWLKEHKMLTLFASIGSAALVTLVYTLYKKEVAENSGKHLMTKKNEPQAPQEIEQKKPDPVIEPKIILSEENPDISELQKLYIKWQRESILEAHEKMHKKGSVYAID